MKIIDCFPFFQELDLLEIRMKFLAPFVDLFVIVEADFTHAGKPKPFRFPHEADWFQHLKNKTRVLKMTAGDVTHWSQYIEDLSNVNEDWVREKTQRQFITSIFPELDDQDLVIFSDLDEVWNPGVLDEMAQRTEKGRIALLEQQVYYYSPDLLEITGNWNHARAGRVHALRDRDLSYIRNKRIPKLFFRRPNILKKAGWHLSWLGGLDAIVRKFHAYSHQEFAAMGMAEKQRILSDIVNLRPVDPRSKSKRRLAQINPRDEMPAKLCDLLNEKSHLFLDLATIGKSVV